MITQQNDTDIKRVWEILQTITDPEIPVLSITDLGIVRDVLIENNALQISITPTYIGCPAMDVIATNIKMELLANGFNNIQIKQVITPAWTTDWITKTGKQKLLEYGIAPPKAKAGTIATDGITCPQCKSNNTVLISEFGSTACKALYKCNNCLEPFDYFKCY